MLKGILVGRKGFRRRAVGVALAGVVLLATAGAVLNPGVKTTELDLNDGGVWVTDSQLRMVGHLNYPAHSLDSGLRAVSTSFNVFQDGETVSVLDVEGSTLTPVDVAATALEMPTELSGLTTAVAAGTVAVTDGVGGNVWVVEEGSLGSFVPSEVDPDVADVPGALSAVGPDGSVHVVSAQAGTLTSIAPKGQRQQSSTQSLEGISPDATLQVAAVGDQGVVLDRSTSTLYLPGGATQVLEGTGLVLQESGPESDRVLVASDSDLLQVPIGGGDVVAAPSGALAGNASRPVMHTGCAYGAWSVSGAFVRDCPDDADDVKMDVASLQTAEQALFRTNRDVMVLNDTATGGLWLPDENLIQVDNWDQVASQLESEEEEENDSVDVTQETLLPDRSEENTPPVAVDDEFGVRAGRTAILPVLQNDSDADTDFMTAVPTSQPSIGTVSPWMSASRIAVRTFDLMTVG